LVFIGLLLSRFLKAVRMPTLTRPAASVADCLKAIVANEDGGWPLRRWNPPRHSRLPLPTIHSDGAVKETDRRAAVNAEHVCATSRSVNFIKKVGKILEKKTAGKCRVW
jgi:hypothetical protein